MPSLQAVSRIDRFLTAERLVLYPTAFAIGSCVAVAAAILLPAATGEFGRLATDFRAPWTAGNFILADNAPQLYDPYAQARFQADALGTSSLSWFVSPPLVAVLYVPLSSLPYGVAVLLWALLSLASLLVALRLLEPVAPRLLGAHQTRTTVAVLATYPTLELLGAGQQSAITLLIWSAGIRLAVDGREIASGACFALGLIKPQLFLFAPLVFLTRRRWSALMSGAALTLTFTIATVAIFGLGIVDSWFDALTSSGYHEQVQVGQAWKMVGVAAFVVSLVPSGMAEAASAVGLGLSFAAAMVAAVQMWRWARDDVPQPYLWALAVLATLAASPHIVAYDAILLIIPILLLIDRHNSPVVRANTLILFVTLWLIPVLHWIGSLASWLTPASSAWTALCVISSWAILTRSVHSLSSEPTYSTHA